LPWTGSISSASPLISASSSPPEEWLLSQCGAWVYSLKDITSSPAGVEIDSDLSTFSFSADSNGKTLLSLSL